MTQSQYPHRFINQYARIPRQVAVRVQSEFAGEYPGVRHCLGLIVTNLLAHGTAAYSRRGNFYSENRTRHYTRANMLGAVKLAEAKGWAVNTVGFRSAGYDRGISSTLTATERLRLEFEPVTHVEIDLTSLPLLTIDGRPVFSIEDMYYIKQKAPASRLLLPTTYDATFRLNREYFNRMSIDYRNLRLEEEHLSVVGLTREFRDGGMGRWFQKGGFSYQGLSEEERAKLLLNGEGVTELDYPAMHPHILYAWEGVQCPDSFYERAAKMCGCSKFVVKSVTLFALNASSYSSLSSAVNLDSAREKKANRGRATPKPILYNELKKLGLKPKDVIETIVKVHPMVSKYLFSNSANRFMLAESDIVTSALLRLMELGISALPVHDSLIVPRRHRDQVKQVMEDAYRGHTGFTISVG